MLIKGALLHGSLHKEPKLYRVVYVDPDTDQIFLLDVDDKLQLGGSRMPGVWSYSSCKQLLQNGTIQSTSECLRTPDMYLADTELPDGELERRAARYSKIKDLVENPQLLLAILNRRTRGAILVAHARTIQVPPTQIYRLLSTYWWFGCDVNALTTRRSTRGGKGHRRLADSKQRQKRGRPNWNVKVKFHPRLQGVNVTARDIEIFTNALQRYYVKQNLTLAESYEEMCTHLYTKWSRNANGNNQRYRINAAFIPTLGQFRYHSRRIIAELGLNKPKAGWLDWPQKYASRTGSVTDIILGPTDVYDMDAGDLKCYSVASFDKNKMMGRVSATFAADRGSGTVVGFHDFVGAESWLYYRLALYSAFTDKQDWAEQLKSLDIETDINSCAVSGFCNGIYVDRGPARGKEAFLTVVDSLRLERAIAPTRRGDLKSPAESVIGIFQRKVAKLPGGYRRIKGERNEQQAKDAPMVAVLTRAQIRRYLIASIAEHNEFHDASNKLTSEMIRDKVAPTPIAIYRWGQKHIRGPHPKHLSNSEIYFKLLPYKDVALTRLGVRYHNAYYTSEPLSLYRSQNLHKRGLKVRVHYDAVDPHRLYWQAPNGSVEVLAMRRADHEKFKGMSWDDLEHYLKFETAGRRARDIDRRNKAYVSNSQMKILSEMSGVKRAKQNTKSRRSITDNRKLEKVRQQAGLQVQSRNALEPLLTAPVSTPTDSVKSAPPETSPHENITRAPPSLARVMFQKNFKRGT